MVGLLTNFQRFALVPRFSTRFPAFATGECRFENWLFQAIGRRGLVAVTAVLVQAVSQFCLVCLKRGNLLLQFIDLFLLPQN